MNADEAYALVERIREFLEDYCDVEDGDESSMTTKATMLVTGCDNLLAWLEKMP